MTRTFLSSLVVIALTIGAGPALAHSKKEGSAPADGSVLSAPPAAIEMTFDMPMRITLITLSDEDGTALELTRSDAMQPVTAFSATPPDLGSGRYTVEWRGLSSDGHPMQGGFSFEITE